MTPYRLPGDSHSYRKGNLSTNIVDSVKTFWHFMLTYFNLQRAVFLISVPVCPGMLQFSTVLYTFLYTLFHKVVLGSMMRSNGDHARFDFIIWLMCNPIRLTESASNQEGIISLPTDLDSIHIGFDQNDSICQSGRWLIMLHRSVALRCFDHESDRILIRLYDCTGKTENQEAINNLQSFLPTIDQIEKEKKWLRY